MSSNGVKVGPTSQTPQTGLWDTVGDFTSPPPPTPAAKELLRYEILHVALDLKAFFGTVRDLRLPPQSRRVLLTAEEGTDGLF